MTTAHTQGGTVLVLGLVMLTVLTLLALAALQGSTLELRVARNGIDRVRSHQAAESTLRQVEARLEASGGAGISSSAPPAAATALPWWRDADAPRWRDAGGGTAHSVEGLGFVRDTLTVGQPRDHRGRDFYALTARAGTDAGRAVVILRSTYARRR
jgi:Tfp pilus assembly protein PilX